ncbi:MAG: NADPH-dependent F420 reductase [Actinomycetota bacterium]
MVDKVCVVGATGDEGFGLALRWAKAGLEVVIGSRDAARAISAAERLEQRVPGANVSGLENTAAVASSDVVVVTVPYGGQAAIYKSIADHVRADAVVVDCTVPVAAAVGGRVTNVLGVWQGSAAQQAASFLPKGTTVMAGFHTLPAALLNETETALDGDVLICGPKGGKPVCRSLVEAIENLRFVDAGALDQARIVEPITALLIGINRRYKIHGAGVRITGLPD